MSRCKHALHRGRMYANPEQATETYPKMMDISSYLHCLLSNEMIRDKLIWHINEIEQLLSGADPGVGYCGSSHSQIFATIIN